MNKRELLDYLYEQACNRLRELSTNWSTAAPKENCKLEWAEAQRECCLLREIRDSFPQENDELTYRGQVANLAISFQGAEPLIEQVFLLDNEGNKRLFGMENNAGREFISQFNKGCLERQQDGKTSEIVVQVDNDTQAIRRWNWFE